MKFLSLLLTLCLWTAVAPARNGDPVFPWPLSAASLPIDRAELQGSWVAYQHNTIWFIDITADSDTDSLMYVELKSNGIRSHRVVGWLHADDRVYMGTLTTDDQRNFGGSIFRDQEGIKIRIIRGQQSFYDLHLYKAK